MKKVLIIYGPTTIGKTSLAINLAKKFNGEIISADSRQIYKKLDIGSGKVSPGDNVSKRNGYWIVNSVKIHGFDIKKPQENFSAYQFAEYAKSQIKKLQDKNKLPIICGGTGFYLKVLLEGLNYYKKPDSKLRKSLQGKNTFQLQNILKKYNSPKFLQMNESDMKNPRRLIRAIELSKTPRVKKNSLNMDSLIIGLTASNKYLFTQADESLKTRLKNGLIKEVENLIKEGIDRNWLKNLGLEYKQLTLLIENELDREAAITRLKADIHSLIKRQKTYFRKLNGLNLSDIEVDNWRNELEKKVTLWYTQRDAG